jgi:hypothetical protein
MTKKLKIVFADGAFDNFEGTQEELNELMAELQNMIEHGTFFDEAKRLSPEEEQEFIEAMDKQIPKLKQ